MITRRIAQLATFLLVHGLCLIAAPAPAQAATTLCKRSDYGCTTGGYQGKDPWGYWKYASSDSVGRLYNCTSYAAFKVAANGARNPGNLGNAVDWDTNARRYGIRVDTTASVGSMPSSTPAPDTWPTSRPSNVAASPSPRAATG